MSWWKGSHQPASSLDDCRPSQARKMNEWLCDDYVKRMGVANRVAMSETAWRSEIERGNIISTQ